MSERMEWEKLLSTKRISEIDRKIASTPLSKSTDQRSAFEKDYDQLIFSYPFRRLQDKTQVIPFPKFDFVHTRLTHSLEVASIGRSLGNLASDAIFRELSQSFITAQNLQKSDIGTLVASACLAHDIGNPPFGHSGEDSISYYFKKHPLSELLTQSSAPDAQGSTPSTEDLELIKSYENDFINFEGNANGFRILTTNFKKGINPTTALVGTYLKYPKESSSKTDQKRFPKYGFFQTEKEIFEEIARELKLIKVKDEDGNEVANAYRRHPLCFLMEAADDIAYRIIDFEDGCRLKIIDFDKTYHTIKTFDKNNEYKTTNIHKSPREIFESIAKLDKTFDSLRINDLEDTNEVISYLRAKIINVLVYHCFKVFEKNYKEIMTGEYTSSLLDGIEEPVINLSLTDMKVIVRKYVYNHTPVLQNEASGFKVMYDLINSFASIVYPDREDIHLSDSSRVQKLNSLLPDCYSYKSEKELKDTSLVVKLEHLRGIVDYVSGMTDNYATSIYKKIQGII